MKEDLKGVMEMISIKKPEQDTFICDNKTFMCYPKLGDYFKYVIITETKGMMSMARFENINYY